VKLGTLVSDILLTGAQSPEVLCRSPEKGGRSCSMQLLGSISLWYFDSSFFCISKCETERDFWVGPISQGVLDTCCLGNHVGVELEGDLQKIKEES